MAVVPASSYGSAPVLPSRDAIAPPPPPTEVPKGTNLVGVLLGIVADAMVLAAIVAILYGLKAGYPAWPPRGVSLGTYLPTTVTITGAMSMFSMQWAVSSIRRNDQRSGTFALLLTLLLGISIFNAQWYSMVRAPFGIADHAYGTLYYLLIGYHAVNVAIGLGALVFVGSRSLAGHFGRQGYDPLRAVAAFWHWTNAAWFVILAVLFLFAPHA